MKRIFTLLTFLLPLGLIAQTPDCDGIRYLTELYPTYDLTTVQYGSNINPQGEMQDLLVDIYEPTGDTEEARPLVIWCFGGAFIGGDRQQMEPYCEFMTQRGYVSASIDYRLWDIFGQGLPDSLDLLDTAVKSIGDLKAAIRFFRQDAATDNLYRIDPNRILVGGLSAGAITALHTAYLNEADNPPDYIKDIVAANGGYEGDSGDADNLSYSSEVQGVINMSGALHRDEWLDAGEPPLISYHGTADEVVPYEFGNASVLGFTFMTLEGSGLLTARAEAEGVSNFLVSVPGGGHEDIHIDDQYTADQINFFVNGTLFMFDEVICPSTVVSTNDPYANIDLAVFPNPASAQITIQWDNPDLEIAQVQLLDLLGRQMPLTAQINPGQIEVYRNNLSNGMYLLQLTDHAGRLVASRKVLFE